MPSVGKLSLQSNDSGHSWTVVDFLSLDTTQIENFVLNKAFTRHSKTSWTRSNLDDFKLSIQDANKILQIKPFIAWY
jgi:hypothetical protein